MEAGGNEIWGKKLDRLSVCITRQEEAALRQATGDTDSSSHQTDLHNHVAALLVKHGLTTWALLHASFPGAIINLNLAKSTCFYANVYLIWVEARYRMRCRF